MHDSLSVGRMVAGFVVLDRHVSRAIPDLQRLAVRGIAGASGLVHGVVRIVRADHDPAERRAAPEADKPRRGEWEMTARNAIH
ncbi:hypothetical protein HGG72_08370 [Ochrobactrum pecoris]|uniref:hypothetical protein n=1 Tax=Brucella pecoris TaxID=867683 RepID=UPI0014448126|nr:hypothetical protein [Brucella pecoris]NKW80353.1 hypothetical protein [Brucella pecoris]